MSTNGYTNNIFQQSEKATAENRKNLLEQAVVAWGEELICFQFSGEEKLLELGRRNQISITKLSNSIKKGHFDTPDQIKKILRIQNFEDDKGQHIADKPINNIFIDNSIEQIENNLRNNLPVKTVKLEGGKIRSKMWEVSQVSVGKRDIKINHLYPLTLPQEFRLDVSECQLDNTPASRIINNIIRKRGRLYSNVRKTFNVKSAIRPKRFIRGGNFFNTHSSNSIGHRSSRSMLSENRRRFRNSNCKKRSRSSKCKIPRRMQCSRIKK